MKNISIGIKKALAMILSLAMVVTFIPLITVQSNADDDAMPAAYENLIIEISAASAGGYSSTEKYTQEELDASDLSVGAKAYFENRLINSGDPDITKLYYALRDMNNDGTPELLIKTAEGVGDDDSLDVIYTIKDGEVVVVGSYAYRSLARVVGKMIYYCGSASAYKHINSIYFMDQDGNIKLEVGFATIYETEDSFKIVEIDEKGNAIMDGDVEKEISEAEFDIIISDYLDADAPEWTRVDLKADPIIEPDPSDDPVDVVLPYNDVKAGDWFIDDVKYVYANKLMNGISDTVFNPEGKITRAMIVTILYRIEGEPAFMNDNVFKDVEANSYYEKAVIWASGKGIVTGTSTTKFSPDSPITREQFAAILYRYAKYIGVDVSEAKDADMTVFNDYKKASSYATEALQWANYEGLITGVTEKTLVPLGNATRAQAAAIFHRFCESDFPITDQNEAE